MLLACPAALSFIQFILSDPIRAARPSARTIRLRWKQNYAVISITHSFVSRGGHHDRSGAKPVTDRIGTRDTPSVAKGSDRPRRCRSDSSAAAQTTPKPTRCVTRPVRRRRGAGKRSRQARIRTHTLCSPARPSAAVNCGGASRPYVS